MLTDRYDPVDLFTHVPGLRLQMEPVPKKKTKAVVVRTPDFEQGAVSNSIGPPALSIFIYRVDFNKTMRAANFP